MHVCDNKTLEIKTQKVKIQLLIVLSQKHFLRFNQFGFVGI